MESLKKIIGSTRRACSPYTSHILTGIAIIAFLVIICRYTKKPPTIETLVSGAGGVSLGSLDSEITSNNKTLETVDLDMKVHEDTYRSIVDNLQDNINLTMVREIVKYSDVISRDPVSKDALKAISDINSLNAFSDALTKTSENLSA